ncbi:NAD(P)-dependent alcohol dehydrogenase [Microbacterium hominis]|uniref:NAD(P)-dependent alcohol dehydrogenase n=2 Tax=Microbacterium hominis TaxID=162426 RepID=A0A7D4Q3A3_9MICO|nr:NAD(P)-dependent alcohol dehydrogenase [Microbacterium hominis]
MRALAQHRYGSTDALAVESRPTPAPAAGQVLLRVRAAGVDRGVWHLMTGRPYLVRLLGFGLRRPAQPVRGADVAGTVVATGEGVARLSPGDEVFGIADGSFAEFALADADRLALAPDSLDAAEAAVLAVSGVTALTAVEEVADVQAGQRVLVLGGSGGVGSYAVQFAAARGAHVTAVASGAKAAFVRSLGAERVIDYQAEDVTASGEVFDAIIDTGGRTPLRRLRRILAPTGTLAIVGGEGGDPLTGGMLRQIGAAVLSLVTRQRLRFFIAPEHHAPMARVAALVAAGRVRPTLTRTYPLDRAAEAIDDLVAGRICGKAAVVIEEES